MSDPLGDAIRSLYRRLTAPPSQPAPERTTVATIGAAEQKRQADKQKVTDDTNQIASMTQTLADDTKSLAGSTAATGTALKGSKKNAGGPFTRADGTAYVLITDGSADGFHEVDLAGPDTVIDEPPAEPPAA